MRKSESVNFKTKESTFKRDPIDENRVFRQVELLRCFSLITFYITILEVLWYRTYPVKSVPFLPLDITEGNIIYNSLIN